MLAFQGVSEIKFFIFTCRIIKKISWITQFVEKIENWEKKISLRGYVPCWNRNHLHTYWDDFNIDYRGGGVQIVCNQVLSICLELELLLSVHYNCPILHWISNEIEGPWTEVFWFSLKIKLYWIYECTTWAMI